MAIATDQTQTADGIEFVETKVAWHYEADVVLIDIGGGAAGVRSGIDDACDLMDIDVVIGTDAGGDVFALGDEPGIKSPVTDAVMLSALSSLEIDSALGVACTTQSISALRGLYLRQLGQGEVRENPNGI